ncbi:hypothetical protein D3Z62_30855 [Lachnospiraceae bacterium]|nr:hypothetical protein [Lachnospiraceae bacterium]
MEDDQAKNVNHQRVQRYACVAHCPSRGRKRASWLC